MTIKHNKKEYKRIDSFLYGGISPVSVQLYFTYTDGIIDLNSPGIIIIKKQGFTSYNKKIVIPFYSDARKLFNYMYAGSQESI